MRTDSHPRRSASRRIAVPCVAALVALPLLSACGAGQDAATRVTGSSIDGANARAGDILIRFANLDNEGDGATLYLSLYNLGDAEDTFLGASTPVGTLTLTRVEGASASPSAGASAGTAPLVGVSTAASPSAPGAASPGVAVASPSVAALPGAASPSVAASPGAAPGAPAVSPSVAASPSVAPSPSASSAAALDGVTLPPGQRVDLLPDFTGRTNAGRLVLTNLSQPLRPGTDVPVTLRFADAGTLTIQVPVQVPDDRSPVPYVSKSESDG